MTFSAGVRALAPDQVGPALEELPSSGACVFHVDTGSATDMTSIIRAIADVVPMDPPTTGRSWDAFSDSLWGGVHEVNAARVALVVRGECWSECVGDVRIALDVFQEVAASLADEKATVNRPTTFAVYVIPQAQAQARTRHGSSS
ncbi:hypothetical protein [Streptomyces sp. NPDC058279]|uniref:barstar family protein n=1 Tax=Streptomyces sp. NPDC058279 TaxID=3346418 RepID=UPI0036E271A0